MITPLSSLAGYYECDCPPKWGGVHCQSYDKDFPGGIAHPITFPTTTDYCKLHLCSEKANNGQCDVSCSLHLCVRKEEAVCEKGRTGV